VYFQEATYRQEGVPKGEKNMDMVWMRNITYNQVIMRRHMELELHRDHELDVTPPPPETMQKCLEDFDHFDLIGAAVIGKLVSLNPGAEQFIAPGSGEPTIAELVSPEERANFFNEVFEKELDTALSPTIIPERVATSALIRMAELLGNQRLKDTAGKRLSEDKIYYPLRLPKPVTLYYRSNEIINQAFEVELAA
jgi:hypothetical protein